MVVAISCYMRFYGKILSNLEQLISPGAKSRLVGNIRDVEPEDQLSLIELSEVNELFSSSLSVIVLPLFSYYVVANKGLDIYKPRKSTKNVTLE